MKKAKRWKLGHTVVMRDWQGANPVKGQLIERTDYQVLIRLKDGTLLWGSTSLLDSPTGEKWPYERDDFMRDKPGSWDRMEARCIRLGEPIPEFQPWLKDNGVKRRRKKRP